MVKLLICTTFSLLDAESTQKILLKHELSNSLNMLFQGFRQRIINGQIYSVGQQQIFNRFTELQLMSVGQIFPLSDPSQYQNLLWQFIWLVIRKAIPLEPLDTQQIPSANAEWSVGWVQMSLSLGPTAESR